MKIRNLSSRGSKGTGYNMFLRKGMIAQWHAGTDKKDNEKKTNHLS